MSGNELLSSGLKGLTQGRAMGQRLQQTRSADRDTMWLLMLLEAMEEASRPELRAKRCDRELLDRLTSHLARPASPRGLYRYSNFSLRN